MNKLIPILLFAATNLAGCVFAELSDLPPAIATPNNDVDMSEDISADMSDMEDMATPVCNLTPTELTSGGFGHLAADQLGDTVLYAITSASGDIKIGRITDTVEHDILEESYPSANTRDLAILALSDTQYLLGIIRSLGAVELYYCEAAGCSDIPVDINTAEAIEFYRDSLPVMALTFRDGGGVRLAGRVINVVSNSVNPGIAIALEDLDVAGADVSKIGSEKFLVYGVPTVGYKMARGESGTLEAMDCTLADRLLQTQYIARTLDGTSDFLARTRDGLEISDCTDSGVITSRYPVDFDFIEITTRQYFVIWSAATLQDPIPVLRGAYLDGKQPKSFVDFEASRVDNIRLFRNENGIHALFGGQDLALRYVKTGVLALARCSQPIP